MWSIRKYFPLLSVIVKIILCHAAKKAVKNINFVSNQVTFDPLYIQDHTLSISPDRATLNIILNIARNFSHDPWAEIILSGKTRKENTYRPLFTYDINVCNILGKEGTQFNNFVSGWVNNFWKYGNLPKSCPIIKGNYSWCGLKAEKLNIPTFLPGGKYRAFIKTYFRKDRFKASLANLSLLMELK